jgi:hypothetical protein
MESNVGRCGLCQEVRALRESHLLPKALYKLARDPSRANPNPVLLAAGRASATSRQIADRFLCDDCEQRFSDRGERLSFAKIASHSVDDGPCSRDRPRHASGRFFAGQR